ncbi:lipopolysaccharide biosynthesis protein [Prosthecobacter sp.]|uniref:lipopolysaccharide biosynthesis protein n=1 Tax=Prosthecobacter sp. TaxID=1965333 RepID=UPI00248929D4|nr:lipopolysaccharide biosynthesis protein [Prosthecobacter sp.]MDI1311677.1 lipopolysaccharide biosynthesis protein [Prosthecobacter sp.]
MSKRLLTGAGVSVLEHITKVSALFISTPLMVRHLGQEGYGQWLLGMVILGYLAMVDLGLSFSVSRFLSSAIGAKDEEKQAAIVHISQRYFRLMGWAVALGSLLASPLTLLILGRIENSLHLIIAIIVCGCALALRFRFRIPGLLLRSNVRYDLLAGASIVRVLLQTSCLCLVLIMGGGILGVGLVQGGGDLLELALQRFFSKKLRFAVFKESLTMSAEYLSNLKREMFHFTRDYMLTGFADTLRFQAGPMVLGSVRGARDIAIYSTALRLILTYVDITNAAFGGGVLMAFGQLHGAGESHRLEKEFRRLAKITAGFAAWAMCGIVLFAQPFLHRWLGTEFDESYAIILILALPYGLVGMQFPAYNLLAAMGRQHDLMWVSCIGGVATALFTIGAGIQWGVTGVATVLGIEMLIFSSVVAPWLIYRCLHLNPLSYLGLDVLWPGFKALLLPLTVAALMHEWLVADYELLFTAGCVYTAAFVLPAPLLLLDGEGRQILKRLVGF